MNKGELIGLPASGKSWVIKKKLLKANGEYKVIKNGFRINKLFNIMVSIVPYANLILLYQKIYINNSNDINLRSYLRRVFIMYERLGYFRRQKHKNIYVDEGPMQSVWAVFYQLPLNERNMDLAKILISSINETNIVVFVSVPKLTHVKRMLQRKRKHPIQNEDNSAYLLSREWLAFILVCLRRKKKIKFIRNL